MSMWRLKVGFEVHARVLARSKLFSGASTAFGLQSANKQVALFDAALPGSLPRVNEACVEQAVRTGIALNGHICERSEFERKHYFYGDSPLGFQITQQRNPIVEGGHVKVKYATEGSARASAQKRKQKSKKKRNKNKAGDDAGKEENESPILEKTVNITRIQLEQDTGKSIEGPNSTNLVDLNRAGLGVMEIVTEPDIESIPQAVEFCKTMRTLLQTTKTCDGNMEEGSLRFDVNVSIHSDTIDSHRVEVKNLNSFKHVEKAIEFEMKRLEELYESKNNKSKDEQESYSHETRGFDAQTGETLAMRTKEGLADYRFFPEPDLPPLYISPDRILHLRETMPILPDEILRQLMDEPYGLSEYDALVLFGESGGVSFFYKVMELVESKEDDADSPKRVANWIINVLIGLNRKYQVELDDSNSISPDFLAKVIDLEFDGTISTLSGKKTLEFAFIDSVSSASTSTPSPIEIIEANGLKQISGDQELLELCQETIKDLERSKGGRNLLKSYRSGGGKGGAKKAAALFEALIGHSMKLSRGRANPVKIRGIMLKVAQPESEQEPESK